MSLMRPFETQLAKLDPSRRAHSIGVGRRVRDAEYLVPSFLRDDLVSSGYLHDIGYGVAVLGFHPLDGANFLKSAGFSNVVCHLVAHHSASTVEAAIRGIDSTLFKPYEIREESTARALEILTWADMTTGPTGERMTLDERIAEAVSRNGPESVVAISLREARPQLERTCYFVEGSMKGSD